MSWEHGKLDVSNIEHLLVGHRLVVLPLSILSTQHNCAADVTQILETIDHRQRGQNIPGLMCFKGHSSEIWSHSDV
jgi:hypothetical protein